MSKHNLSPVGGVLAQNWGIPVLAREYPSYGQGGGTPVLAWGTTILARVPQSWSGDTPLRKGPGTSHWGTPQKGSWASHWGIPRRDMGSVVGSIMRSK